jgi:hypothetical protein
MPDEKNKEAWRMFYMVKGHFRTNEASVLASADGYFRRLFRDGADGAPLYDYDEEFEIEWKKLMEKQKNDKLD